MAKKKVTHTQSQSNDPKKETPPPTMDDPSIQIQNLKNLNSVLLKQTTHHRQQIESLLHSKTALQSALHRSAMDAEALISSELEKDVLFVVAETQISEIGFRFNELVGESNERRNYEVAVLEKQVSDLTICLENEKLLLSMMSEERDQMKAEAEIRERKAEEIRLEAEKLFEEKREREKTIEELQNNRVLAVQNSRELANVVDELKEKIEALTREKNEAEVLNTSQETKILQLKHELSQLNELLKNSRNEEALLRASLGLAVEKEEEMANKNRELLRENEEMESNIEVLTVAKDRTSMVLESLKKQLERARCELDEANRVREEIERVKVSCENEIVELRGEMNRLGAVVIMLEERCRELEENNMQLLSQVDHYENALNEVKLEKENIGKGFDEEKSKAESLELKVVEMEKKNEQLLSQVHDYKNAFDELELEKDTLKKGLDEKKKNLENLKLEVAGMEEKFQKAEAELGLMRNEREKMNERNNKLGGLADVLLKEKESLQSSLVEAQQECDELRTKFDSSCIISKQALEMVRTTAAFVGKEKDSSTKEVMVANEKKKLGGGEIQLYAEELEAIRKAFKVRNEMVDDMKEQLVSMQKSVVEAHKGKSLWTGISSATTILAAALTAYIARGR